MIPFVFFKIDTFVVLVLLHDALGSVAQWRDFPENLARDTNCRVVVYDRPLHGLSDRVSYGSIKEQFDSEMELLHDLLCELGVKMPGLIGVSDGATISLNYATSYPTSFVVAMAPHVIMEDKIIKGINGWMEKRDEFEPKQTAFHSDYTKGLIDQWYLLWQKADRDGWDMTGELEKITCPIMLIQDPEDPYGSLQQIDAVGEKVDMSRVELLEGAGHFPYVQFPDKVIGLVKTLL